MDIGLRPDQATGETISRDRLSLRQDAAFRYPGKSDLYAVSYHPARLPTQAEQARMSFYELGLDKPLPTVPLPLRRGPTVPLALESAYMEARGRSRL